MGTMASTSVCTPTSLFRPNKEVHASLLGLFYLFSTPRGGSHLLVVLFFFDTTRRSEPPRCIIILYFRSKTSSISFSTQQEGLRLLVGLFLTQRGGTHLLVVLFFFFDTTRRYMPSCCVLFSFLTQQGGMRLLVVFSGFRKNGEASNPPSLCSRSFTTTGRIQYLSVRVLWFSKEQGGFGTSPFMCSGFQKNGEGSVPPHLCFLLQRGLSTSPFVEGSTLLTPLTTL